MRRVIVTEFVTLDGVMEAPEKWTFPFGNEEAAKFKRDELFESDALLLGRVTYEGFAVAWPSRTDEEGFADRINSLPKFVVSTTLNQVDWKNSRLIKSNVAEEVAKLKQQPGQGILIYGSGQLVNSLMQDGLIDEYRLMVYPLVMGSGKRLFRKVHDTTELSLVESKVFSTGVVVLTYQPADKRVEK
jgi:dihydrofolate reductase